MKIDGYVEPIILFFPITVPVSVATYTQTFSDAPVVSSLYWEETSCAIGESNDFYVKVENVFRGSPVSGVLDIIVREDVSFASDVNARTYSFPVNLQPGKSDTFSDSFVPYKESSTQGFFLKAQWGSTVLSEQSSSYPPRLQVIEGRLGLENVYWAVNNKAATSCELGEKVEAHVILRAYDATVEDSIKIKIKKDLPLWLDKDFKTMDYSISLKKGESKECVLMFTPDEPSGSGLNGYFVEIEDGISWTMDDTYPPRLSVIAEEEGTASVLNVWWTTTRGTVTEVEQGEEVQGHVRIKAVGGDISSSIKIRVRKDIPILPDQDHKVQTYTVPLSENQEQELTISFTASDYSSSTFSGYFVQVDFITQDMSWTLENTYPPRLTVKERAEEQETPEEGTPSLVNVWWTVNNQKVTEAKQGQTVKANVRVKAVGGYIDGTITVRIRRDLRLLPDEDHEIQSYSVKLSENQIADLVLTFAASDKSGLTFRGYFVQIDFESWGTSWTMDDSYPPRLKIS